MSNEEVLKLKDVAALLKVGDKTGNCLLSRSEASGDSPERTSTHG